MLSNSIKSQLQSQFNEYIPEILNSTLNHEILNNEYVYTYHDPMKGEQKVTFEHNLFSLGLDPTHGFKITYQTKIKGD